jgi:antitoxin component of MazEF toxin-antitoxin module
METFTAKLRRVGNSLSILVPKSALDDLGVKEGDEVDVALLPLREERRRRLGRVIGSMPGLGPFQRERKDRY